MFDLRCVPPLSDGVDAVLAAVEAHKQHQEQVRHSFACKLITAVCRAVQQMSKQKKKVAKARYASALGSGIVIGGRELGVMRAVVSALARCSSTAVRLRFGRSSAAVRLQFVINAVDSSVHVCRTATRRTSARPKTRSARTTSAISTWLAKAVRNKTSCSVCPNSASDVALLFFSVIYEGTQAAEGVSKGNPLE